MITDLISLIFPQNCLNCQCSLLSHEQFICTYCKLDFPVTSDHQDQDNDLLKKFAFEPKIIRASAYLYFSRGGIAQKLLHQLKYKGKKEVGVLLGRWYASFLKEQDLDYIIPVPLHNSKMKKRGFNQSECFANGLSQVLEVEVLNDVAKRTIPTISQTNKSKVGRWKNIENVYSIQKAQLVENKRILVVDDVITTGATIGMLCEKLADINVKSMTLACIARGK